jgi:hypothetical protein
LKQSSWYADRAVAVHKPVFVNRIVAIIMLMVTMFSMVSMVLLSRMSASATDPFSDMVCSMEGGTGLNTIYRNFDGSMALMSFGDRTYGSAADSKAKTDATAKMSILDLYGSTLNWTTYNGTPKPEKIPFDKGNIFGLSEGDYLTDQTASLTQNSQDMRNFVKCWGSSWITMLAGTNLGLANGISNISAFFVSKAVDPDFICQDATNSAGASCINLLAVIGGTGAAGDDGGIIGRLYSGLYQGLIILVWAGVGIWVAWTGLVKRRLTSALGGLFGAFVIFGLGVIFLNNPLLIAQAPMRIGTTVGGCVVEGISGVNCLSSSSSDPNGEPSTNTECYVDDAADVDVSRALNLVARQSTCQIWKAFVLEPWAVGQFGQSYESLYYKQGGSTGQIFQNKYTKGTLDKIWNVNDGKSTTGVSLYASNSDPMGTCNMESSKFTYKNLALYQLNLQSTLHTCNGSVNTKYHSTANLNYLNGSNSTYGDWYWMATTLNATNASAGKGTDDISYMWRDWVGDNSFSRLGVGIIAVIASVGGALTLVTTSVLAIMYLFMGVLLTAFAPLFLLIGIIPGQGKKIFLGWLENVVSAILKYFACVLWMMVTVELYGAVLANSSGLGGTLIFVIIVSMAMFIYRKEFLKMIGQANFGGTKFSNRMGDVISNRAKKIGKFATLTGASAAAGYIAGGENHQSYKGKSLGQKIKTFGHNVSDRTTSARNQAGFTGMQQLKRGNGITANAARSYDKIMDARRKTTLNNANQAASKLRKVSDDAHRKNVGVAVDRDMVAFNKAHPKASKQDQEAERKRLTAKYTQDISTAKKSAADLEAKKITDKGGMSSDGKRTVAEVRRDDLKTVMDNADHKRRSLTSGAVLRDPSDSSKYAESSIDAAKRLGMFSDDDYADYQSKKIRADILTSKAKSGKTLSTIEKADLASTMKAMNSSKVKQAASAMDEYRKNTALVDGMSGRELSAEDKVKFNNAQRALSKNAVTNAIDDTVNTEMVAHNGFVSGLKNMQDVKDNLAAVDKQILDADTEYSNGVTLNDSIDSVATLDRQVTIAEKNANRLNARRDSGSIHNRVLNDVQRSADLANDLTDTGGYDEDELISQMTNLSTTGGGSTYVKRRDQLKQKFHDLHDSRRRRP